MSAGDKQIERELDRLARRLTPEIPAHDWTEPEPAGEHLVLEGLRPGILGWNGTQYVALMVTLRGESETVDYVLRLDGQLDPYTVAGDLLGCADALLRQTAIEEGLDKREEQIAVRLKRKQAERARRQSREAATEAIRGTGCDFCDRSLAYMIDGVRYCKRHAEEHGVRPHGKIGGEET